MEAFNNPKLMRSLGLAIICLIAFFQTILYAFYLFISKDYPEYSPGTASFLLFGSALEKIFLIGLVFYILALQKQNTLSYLGFSFNLNVLLESWILFLAVGVGVLLAYQGSVITWKAIGGRSEDIDALLSVRSGSLSFIQGVGPISIFAMLVNPFFEEILVRAYFTLEMEYLTGNALIAIITGLVLQGSYHLYQGLGPTLILSVGFTILAVYYRFRQQIVPVILVHLYSNLLTLFSQQISSFFSR
jgi:membrane protease YdiL (CAAX protease family)